MPIEAVVIHLHRGAPPKPAFGRPCNGCGVCCAAEPCPAGALLSRRRQGACVALRWDEDGAVYRCGLLVAPRELLPWLPAAAVPGLARLARRWIAAGRGCDSAAEVDSPPAA